MEEIVRQVRAVLEQRFPGSTIDVEETVPGRKIGGIALVAEFEDLDMVDRQNAVWDALRGSLSSEVLRHVGLILTLTPTENAAWADPAAV